MRKAITLLIALFVLTYADSASAMRFGHQETIYDVQEITGTEFVLSYKISTYWFFLGLYLEDDGYVLEKKSESGYYSLTKDQKNVWIEEGKLSDPLPSYSISYFDYALGYSLWIFLVVMFIWISFDFIKERLFPGEAEAEVSEVSPDLVEPHESNES